MDWISLSELAAFAQVVVVDLVLAGDNAVVIGMAVAGLPREQRARAMFIGIAAATVLRILFASITVQLLQVIGLLLAGGLLLLWVSWKLWRELQAARYERSLHEPHETAADANGEPRARPREKSLRESATQIIVADVSMSLDNVLAVAGVAREHAWVLVFGLSLSVALMAFAAVMVARLLQRFHWIGYVGLALIFYVSLRMIYEGTLEIVHAANGVV
ncbi:MAG TPA: TerC family protein [Gammaproteobacteria bacterium]